MSYRSFRLIFLRNYRRFRKPRVGGRRQPVVDDRKTLFEAQKLKELLNVKSRRQRGSGASQGVAPGEGAAGERRSLVPGGLPLSCFQIFLTVCAFTDTFAKKPDSPASDVTSSSGSGESSRKPNTLPEASNDLHKKGRLFLKISPR